VVFYQKLEKVSECIKDKQVLSLRFRSFVCYYFNFNLVSIQIRMYSSQRRYGSYEKKVSKIANNVLVGSGPESYRNIADPKHKFQYGVWV
jgi:hypothetical protein